MSRKPRCFVAMSGGVDSSVAAALLVEQGFDVTGIMMKLWTLERANAANGLADSEDELQARRVAQALNIPFHLVDMSSTFQKEIVEYYVQSLALGLTPNPCFVCNQKIKWGVLLEEVERMGGDLLASGHYARVETNLGGKVILRKALDTTKDQSYVLAGLNQETLRRIILPNGSYTKTQVREIAHRYGFFQDRVQKESQDLCFLSDHDQGEFLALYQPALQKNGVIQTVEGEVLGQHHGLSNYTIGQRKGVSKGGGTPYYVAEKNVTTNTLIVCRKEQLGTSRIRIESINWLNGYPPVLPFTADIKIRYKATPVRGMILDNGKCGCDIIFDILIRDATPGQYAVIYDDDIVLGSGVITKTTFAEEA